MSGMGIAFWVILGLVVAYRIVDHYVQRHIEEGEGDDP